MIEEDGHFSTAKETRTQNYTHGNNTVGSRSSRTMMIGDVSSSEIKRMPQLVGSQYENILQQLREGVLTPQLRIAKGLSGEGLSGIIIEGPTGYGKTAIVNQLVFECQKHFKILDISCSQLVHKVVGDSEREIEDLFATARRNAPTIIVLENIESLLGNNAPSDINNIHSSRRSPTSKRRVFSNRSTDIVMDRLLSCFLTNLDGIFKCESPNGDMEIKSSAYLPKVVVIATTRDMSSIDSSILRPGRLEEHIQLKSLSEDDRKSIITQSLNNIAINDDEKGTVVKSLIPITAGWYVFVYISRFICHIMQCNTHFKFNNYAILSFF